VGQLKQVPVRENIPVGQLERHWKLYSKVLVGQLVQVEDEFTHVLHVALHPTQFWETKSRKRPDGHETTHDCVELI
jgi:hypothetical protein